MKPITRSHFERLRDDAQRLVETLNDPNAWHAIEVLNSSSGNTTPAPNPNSGGAETCSCIQGSTCPHGTTTEKAALSFDPDLLQDQRQLATLGRLVNEVAAANSIIQNRMPTGRGDIPCSNCSSGSIPTGRSRCNNAECNSHANTRTRCQTEACYQPLIPGTTGKTKPHTHPETGVEICRNHYEKAQRDLKYARNRGTGAQDIHDTAGMTSTEDAA